MPAPDASVLIPALRAALQANPGWAQAPLALLPDQGLAHCHIRLGGTGLLARIPKQSQLGLPPQENLRQLQACFDRCGASGHTPRLQGTLPVSAGLMWGALLVEEIVGKPAQLPTDLSAVAQALAALHALPLPEAAARPPLGDAADPLEALVDEVLAQAAHVCAAGLDAAVMALIRAELDALRRLLQQPGRPPRRLIAFDAHPGNFLMRDGGDAVLVDLEKCRYSYPGLDLAHATLYTSTTWDAAAQAVLTADEVEAFYRTWEHDAGAELAAASRPWHLPLRHAMWLWSISWCCKWRALSGQPARHSAAGEDWSTQLSDAALVGHVRERVEHYLSLGTLQLVQRELRALQAAFAP